MYSMTTLLPSQTQAIIANQCGVGCKKELTDIALKKDFMLGASCSRKSLRNSMKASLPWKRVKLASVCSVFATSVRLRAARSFGYSVKMQIIFYRMFIAHFRIIFPYSLKTLVIVRVGKTYDIKTWPVSVLDTQTDNIHKIRIYSISLISQNTQTYSHKINLSLSRHTIRTNSKV